MSFPFKTDQPGPPLPRQTVFEAFVELGWGVSFGIAACATSAAGMLVLFGWLIWWLLS